MRPLLRGLVWLVLVTVLCLVLLFLAGPLSPDLLSERLPLPSLRLGTEKPPPPQADLPEKLPAPSSLNLTDGGHFENVTALWQYWGQHIHNARPLTDPVALSYASGNIPLNDGEEDSGRAPPANKAALSDAAIRSMKRSHGLLVEALNAQNISQNAYHGQGVVTVAGGEYFGPAMLGLQMLRQTGSTLPVEMFLADESEYEPAICDDYLPKLNARCLVITRFFTDDTFEVTHYQLKSLAMLFSSFAHVLYLDSDSIPLFDPAKSFFESEPYTSTGLVTVSYTHLTLPTKRIV